MRIRFNFDFKFIRLFMQDISEYSILNLTKFNDIVLDQLAAKFRLMSWHINSF